MTKIPILMHILNSVYEHVCSRRKIKLLWNFLKHIRIENKERVYNVIACKEGRQINRYKQRKEHSLPGPLLP